MSKTPRVGECFTYQGERYEITKVPTFSSVVGKNVNPLSGKPSTVKLAIRDPELELDCDS